MLDVESHPLHRLRSSQLCRELRRKLRRCQSPTVLSHRPVTPPGTPTKIPTKLATKLNRRTYRLGGSPALAAWVRRRPVLVHVLLHANLFGLSAVAVARSPAVERSAHCGEKGATPPERPASPRRSATFCLRRPHRRQLSFPLLFAISGLILSPTWLGASPGRFPWDQGPLAEG
jgi:hypothetical protein